MVEPTAMQAIIAKINLILGGGTALGLALKGPCSSQTTFGSVAIAMVFALFVTWASVAASECSWWVPAFCFVLPFPFISFAVIADHPMLSFAAVSGAAVLSTYGGAFIGLKTRPCLIRLLS